MEHTLINRQIDDFVVKAHIGYSALSIIFRAHQVSLNRPVALKVLGLEETPLERQTFLREFMAQSGAIMQIEHLHLLPVYAYGVVEDELAYIAARLTPQKLSELLHERTISLRHTAQIITQIASGVDYAYSKGVLHGTLTPGNIYLDDEQNAFINDYEMAQIVQRSQSYMQLLRILGTPVYASPEQLRLEPLSHRSDIYSLGAILYRMTTGREPFEMPTGSIPELLRMHQQDALIPPRTLNPEIPPDAEAAILKGMHENPAERFETAQALARAFEAAVRGSASSVMSRPASPAHASLPDQKAALWVVVTAALLIILVLVTFLLLTEGG